MLSYLTGTEVNSSYPSAGAVSKRKCPKVVGEQRQLRRTWYTPELVKAIEVGYHIVKIHEVWHFPPEQRIKGLFADYENTWLKIKQESATTPETKACYITQYKQKENIDLDSTLIVKNP